MLDLALIDQVNIQATNRNLSHIHGTISVSQSINQLISPSNYISSMSASLSQSHLTELINHPLNQLCDTTHGQALDHLCDLADLQQLIDQSPITDGIRYP